MRKISIVLKNPRRITGFITYARSILVALTDNPEVPRPSVPLATLAEDIAALEAAHALALTRGIGLVGARNARLAKVWGHLDRLRVDVQAAASQSPCDGAGLAARAGMRAKRRPSSWKVPIDVRPGRVSGSARVIVKAAGDRVSYEWQYSLDGESWIDLPPTRKAKTDVSGFTPRTRVFFRCRTLSKDGLGDFGQGVSMLIL